eukprot:15028115-Ditylum_brightwellii.AAC.1
MVDSDSIIADLENVENALQIPASVISSEPTTPEVGGRAHFDSIRSALGSVRRRLSRLGRRNDGSGEEEIEAVLHSGENREVLVRDLTERLEDAERAHSARIPLEMARSQRNMSSSLSSSMMSLGDIAKGVGKSLRRSSSLIASHKLVRETEGLSESAVSITEADIHKLGAHVSQTMPSIIERETSISDQSDLDDEEIIP